MPTIQHVLDLVSELAPPHLAASWDNVGLQVGDPSQDVIGITVAVDPTLAAVEATIELGANLMITHHPLLFKAPKQLDLRQEPGRTISRLIKADVALHAAHTNLDATAVNHALAEQIGIVGTTVLHRTGRTPIYKVGVYVPAEAVDEVAEAAWGAGAGRDDRYERAMYSEKARETFRPKPGADPARGKAGEQVRAKALRLEFLVGAVELKAVRCAIESAHPYESPALDIVALHDQGEPEGWGLVGDLAPARTLADLARHVKAALNLPAVRIVGDPERPISRVAWLGGSGGDYYPEALAAGAQCYITGEVRHHAALDGLAAGVCYLEIGHVGSEQPVVPYLANWLRERLPGVPVMAIDQVDPFTVI